MRSLESSSRKLPCDGQQTGVERTRRLNKDVSVKKSITPRTRGCDVELASADASTPKVTLT
jgi:hypothetical protein